MFSAVAAASRNGAGARRRVPRAVAVRRHRARPAHAREQARGRGRARLPRRAARARGRVVRRARPDGHRRHRGAATAARSSPISARSCSTCRKTCRCPVPRCCARWPTTRRSRWSPESPASSAPTPVSGSCSRCSASTSTPRPCGRRAAARHRGRLRVRSRRRSARRGPAGDGGARRRRAARTHGDPLRRGRAVRPARARAAHRRGHPAQRRRRPHPRRERARAVGAGPARPPRPRLPPPRRDGAAGGCAGLVPRARGAVGTLGAHQPARRRRAGCDAMARAARPPRAARWRPRWPRSWPSPTASRAPTGTSTSSTRCASSTRSSPSSATCSRPARNRERAGATCRPGPPAPARVPRRTTHAGAPGPTTSSTRPTRWRRRSIASPGSTRSSPRPGSTCSAARSSSSSTPTSGASATSAHGDPHGPRVARSRARPRPGVRLRSRRGHVPRPGPRRLAAARRRPARAPTACCALRRLRVDDDHRRLLAALAAARGDARAPLPEGRSPPHHRAHAVAVPPRHRRSAHRHPSLRRRPAPPRRRMAAAGPVVRGRHRARRPSPRPSRSTGCGRCSTTPDATAATSPRPRSAPPTPRSHAASTARSPARAPRSPASTATSAASRCRARPVDDAVVSPTRLEHVGHLALRLPHGAHPPGGDRRAPRGGVGAVAARSRHRSCTTRSTSSSARSSRVPAARPAPGAAWTDADRARLHEIAEQQCARYEALGLTGRRAFWDRDRRRILADLDRFLVEDSELRAGHGLTTLATELRSACPRPSGRRSRSRCPTVVGCTSAGRPTASTAAPPARCSSSTTRPGSPFAVGDEGDPTSAGRKLQLPVYALAAKSAFGNDDTPVDRRRTGS